MADFEKVYTDISLVHNNQQYENGQNLDAMTVNVALQNTQFLKEEGGKNKADFEQKLKDETARAEKAEGENKQAIAAEQARAQAAEAANAQLVADEKARAEAAEKANAQLVADEQSRAGTAEGALADDISALQTRASNIESKNTQQDTAIQNAQNAADNAQSTADGKYTKPNGGIPKTDLASDVAAALDKAGSSLQSIPVASKTVLGGVKIYDDTVQSVASNPVSSSANRTYPVQKNAKNELVVNVPWEGKDIGTFTETEDGLVPAPQEVTNKKYLRDDGTWQEAVGATKPSGFLSVEKEYIKFVGAANTEETVRTYKIGSGALSVSVTPDGVVNAKISGEDVIITYLKTGDATIEISVAEDDKYTEAHAAIFVSAYVFDSVLDNNSWEDIHLASEMNVAESAWSVGDVKGVLLNGGIGGTDVKLNAIYYIPILGFNHNSFVEGEGITFGGLKTAKTDGVLVGLVDRYYQASSYRYYGDFAMYKNATPHEGYIYWNECRVRYTVLGSTNVNDGGDAPETSTKNPVVNSFMAALPEELRAVMKPVTKYHSGTQAVIDYLFLLSEFEVFGKNTYQNVVNRDEQYAYFSGGNSRIIYNYKATNSAVSWWLRNGIGVKSGSTIYSYFCCVSATGEPTRNITNDTYAIFAAFVV